MAQKPRPNQKKKIQDKLRISALRKSAKDEDIYGRLIWLHKSHHQYLSGLFKEWGWEVNSPGLALAAWTKNKPVEPIKPEKAKPTKPIVQKEKRGDKSQLSAIKSSRIDELMLFDFPAEVASGGTTAKTNSSDAIIEQGGGK